MRGGTGGNTVGQFEAATEIQEQWLSAVVEKLAFPAGSGIKRQHFLTEFLHPGDNGEVDRVLKLGHVGEIGFQRNDLLLRHGVIQYVTITNH